MLFDHKRQLEDLRRDGRHGTAEILSMKTLGSVTTAQGMSAPDEDLSYRWTECWMKLRVVPDDRDEAAFEADVTTRIHTMKWQGYQVPVWYDPDDHSKVVVDYEADLQQQEAEVQRLVEVKQHFNVVARDAELSDHRYDQRLGLAWTPIAGELYPVEAAVTPGTGRLTVTGELLANPAQAAIACVQRNAGQLAPELPTNWFAEHDIHIFQPYGNPPGAEDGASTGLAIAAALVSVLRARIVRTDVALTGEITPAGEVLLIAELIEKAQTAKRQWADRLVAPAGNEQDLSGRQRADLELVFVTHVDEAMNAALAKKRFKGATNP
jgi:ATP-dependent Lon protease